MNKTFTGHTIPTKIVDFKFSETLCSKGFQPVSSSDNDC